MRLLSPAAAVFCLILFIRSRSVLTREIRTLAWAASQQNGNHLLIIQTLKDKASRMLSRQSRKRVLLALQGILLICPQWVVREGWVWGGGVWKVGGGGVGGGRSGVERGG